jgi:hypothetical protein
MARHDKGVYEGKNSGSASVFGMDQVYKKEIEASRLACQRASEALPPDAFADDDPEAVKEDHRKYYHKPTDIGAARSALDDAGYSEDG